MMQGLFWIVVVYAASAAAVQAVYRRYGGRVSGAKHYVLHTMNDQRHIEWVVRSLAMFYWLRGKPAAITIVDEGSSDDTLAIARCLSRRLELDIRSAAEGGAALNVASCAANRGEGCGAEIVHVRLYRPEEMEKLPPLHAAR